MNFQETNIPGVILCELKAHGDQRGYFMELHHQEKHGVGGIGHTFVQDNVSFSERGVLRGLHYQLKFPQGKLVSALQGEIFDVAVDIRQGSDSFGKWVGATLSAENHRQLYVPPGFAHGFLVLSETALVHYKCTDVYHPEDDRGILWSDPQIGIEWPMNDVQVSEKDGKLAPLSQVSSEELPQMNL